MVNKQQVKAKERNKYKQEVVGTECGTNNGPMRMYRGASALTYQVLQRGNSSIAVK